MSELHNKLATIQKKLKVPKDQRNDFGGFNYRSAEDIIKKFKSLKESDGLTLTLPTEMVLVGDRVYVKASAVLSDGTDSVVSEAYAREELTKKGMDAAQITGAATSYARKYALGGLFAIDDGNDPDSYVPKKTSCAGRRASTKGAVATKPNPRNELLRKVLVEAKKRGIDGAQLRTIAKQGIDGLEDRRLEDANVGQLNVLLDLITLSDAEA